MIVLREMLESDLPILFEFQRDPEAVRMAAFVQRDPHDWAAFETHWKKCLADPSIASRTVLFEGRVVGSVGRYVLFGQPEVTYWIARQWWGRGMATAALGEFLQWETTRPIYGHAAKDNVASLRVLEKCGFQVVGSERSFAGARGEEIDEVALERTT